jgi:hypothetical protein
MTAPTQTLPTPARPAPTAPTAPRRAAPPAAADRRPRAKLAVLGGHVMVVGRRGVVRWPSAAAGQPAPAAP